MSHNQAERVPRGRQEQLCKSGLNKIITSLRPLRHVTIRLPTGHHINAEPAIPADTAEILRGLGH